MFCFWHLGKVNIKVKVTSLEMISTRNTMMCLLQLQIKMLYGHGFYADNKMAMVFMLITKNNHDDYNNTGSFTIPHFYIKHTNHPLNRVVHENKTKK